MALFHIIILILLFNFIYPAYADAYIDPNTGGVFFQVVAPFVYGILGAIVIFWKRILGFVRRLFGRNKNESGTDQDS